MTDRQYTLRLSSDTIEMIRQAFDAYEHETGDVPMLEDARTEFEFAIRHQ